MLLRQRDFRHLFVADALSQLGSRVSLLAFPLLAVTTLDASTLQVSLLRAVESVPLLFLGLPAGAWCDRMRARPVVIATDLGRAVALGSVPLAALFGWVSLGQLYAVLFVAGGGTVFYEVAHKSYLPRLVAAPHLVEGNAKLQGNASVGAIAGPTVAGYLVQWFTAPAAIAFDALSYLWSALWLRGIRTPEPRPHRAEHRHLRREVAEGLRFVRDQPVLRAICGHSATMIMFQSVNMSVSVVFLVRELGLSAGAVGLLGTVGLLGAIVAALTARRITAAFGQARVLRCSAVAAGLAFLLYPFTGRGLRLGFWVAAGFVAAFCIIVMNVIEATFQQTVTPDRLRGRVNATVRFLGWAPIPVGALLGGVLGSTAGLRPTLWVAGVGVLVSPVWLLCSPLRGRRDIEAPAPLAAASP